MANITLGTEYLTRTLQETSVLGIDSALSIILTLFLLLIITRQITQWTTLALPIQTMIWIGGIKPNLLVLTISAITFVIANLSLKQLGTAWKTRSEKQLISLTKEAGARKTLAKAERLADKFKDTSLKRKVEEYKQKIRNVDPRTPREILEDLRRKAKGLFNK